LVSYIIVEKETSHSYVMNKEDQLETTLSRAKVRRMLWWGLFF